MKFGIFIYPDVEPIDLATFGVLSMARRIRPEITICTIAPHPGEVRLASGLRVIADYGLNTAPPVDVLVVTGGPGWTTESLRPETHAFLQRRASDTLIVSVCTGGMILAASGLLEGRAATTKTEVVPPEASPLDLLRARYPQSTCARPALWTRAPSSPGVASRSASTRCCICSAGCSARRAERDGPHHRI